MIDATQLGHRLQVARERRRLSQQAVANVLDLPRTAVTNMENGNRAVSTLELAKLAEVYRCSAASFFAASEEPGVEDLSVVLHRALPEMEHAPEVEATVANMLDLCREGTALRRILRQTIERTLPNYATRMTNAGDAIRQGETVARDERRRLGLGNAPIRNIADLIGDQGIWTTATDLPDSLSGLFVNHPAIGLAILINRQHRPMRRRFSRSHEYAHALFDRDETVTTTRRQNSSELSEKRASAFAAAFLMPPEGVAEQLAQIGKGRPSRRVQSIFDVANNSMIEADVRARPGSQAITHQDAAILARHFGVGFEAAVWRLKSLNRIGAKEAATLVQRKDTAKRSIELLGFHELLEEGAPPEACGQEFRSRLLRLATEAFRQEEISRGRLIEIGRKLSINGNELIELAEATRLE